MILERSVEIRGDGTVSVNTVAVNRSGFDLTRWFILTVAVLLVIATVVLCSRRVVGALQSPLSLSALMTVGLFVALSAATVRISWRRTLTLSTNHRLTWFDRLIACCPTATVLGVGLALSLHGTPTGSLIAFWAILVTEECLTAWRLLLPTKKASVSQIVRVDPPQMPTPHVPHPTPSVASEANVTQQLTHARADDGSETISGWLRVTLAPGQRIASLHVAFCPSFERTPTLDVNQLSGPSGRIKTIQLLPYGTRFDLKLSHPYPEPTTVTLEFVAHSQLSAD